jgi:hypothetical protein
MEASFVSPAQRLRSNRESGLVQNAQMRQAHLSRPRQAQRELRRERPGAERGSGQERGRRGIEWWLGV